MLLKSKQKSFLLREIWLQLEKKVRKSEDNFGWEAEMELGVVHLMEAEDLKDSVKEMNISLRENRCQSTGCRKTGKELSKSFFQVDSDNMKHNLLSHHIRALT